MSTSETYNGNDSGGTIVPRSGFDGVSDRLDLDGDPQASARTRIALGKCYDYLAKYGTSTERNLQWFYDPYTHAQPSTGRYDTRRAWWGDVGRSALLSLPGVAEGPDRHLRFTGVSEGAVGETVPRDALDVNDDVRAAHVLNGTEFTKGRQREAVRDTWEYLRSVGELSTDDLQSRLADHDGVHHPEHFWPTARDVLANMPGVDVTREGGTPDPAEIEVKTLADVIDGLREVGALDLDVEHEPGNEVWRGS